MSNNKSKSSIYYIPTPTSTSSSSTLLFSTSSIASYVRSRYLGRHVVAQSFPSLTDPKDYVSSSKCFSGKNYFLIFLHWTQSSCQIISLKHNVFLLSTQSLFSYVAQTFVYQLYCIVICFSAVKII